MRIIWFFAVLTVVATSFVAGHFTGADAPISLCSPDESCIREWVAATSGWAAVFAAIPTLWYLSKQVRDADRHQKTGFAIQLRKHRILATRTARIAYVALDQMDKQAEERAASDLRHWDKETVEGILHHLRDVTISAFESEIAHPISVGGWGMAMIFERGHDGIEPALQNAPGIARRYFENLRDQAEAYLTDVSEITKHR